MIKTLCNCTLLLTCLAYSIISNASVHYEDVTKAHHEGYSILLKALLQNSRTIESQDAVAAVEKFEHFAAVSREYFTHLSSNSASQTCREESDKFLGLTMRLLEGELKRGLQDWKNYYDSGIFNSMTKIQEIIGAIHTGACQGET